MTKKPCHCVERREAFLRSLRAARSGDVAGIRREVRYIIDSSRQDLDATALVRGLRATRGQR